MNETVPDGLSLLTHVLTPPPMPVDGRQKKKQSQRMLRASETQFVFPHVAAFWALAASSFSLPLTFSSPLKHSFPFSKISITHRHHAQQTRKNNFVPSDCYTTRNRFAAKMTKLSFSTEVQAVIDSSHQNNEIEGNISNSIDAEKVREEQKYTSFKEAIETIYSKRNVLRELKKSREDVDAAKRHLLDRQRKLSRLDVQQLLPSASKLRSTKPNSNPNKKGIENSDAIFCPQNPAQMFTAGDLPVPDIRQKLTERRQKYLDRTGLTIAQHRLAMLLLAYLADHCAKTADPLPLYAAWDIILEAGMAPLERTLSTYLYVLGLGNEAKIEKEESEDDPETQVPNNQSLIFTHRDVTAEVAIFHDTLYAPTEKTITLQVKSLVSKGEGAAAEALLDGIPDESFGQLKHRTMFPILTLYSSKGDISSALRLYHRMRHISRVKMESTTYVDFISAIAGCGYFRTDSNPIDGAKDLGYHPSFGPELLDILISDMADDVLEISEESARLLRNGFAMGFSEKNIESISHPDDFKPLTSCVKPGAMVADRVEVNHGSAKCPATDTTLRLIVLEENQRVHVHDTLLDMAKEKSKQYIAKLAAKGRTKGKDDAKSELAAQILKEFSEWLDTRPGKPFTAILDGANIAYYGWGKINIYQLMLMVNTLEKQNENPLVIMPEKYTRKKFHLRHRKTQILSDKELDLLENLKQKGQLYSVAPMCHDDMYWMLASVSNQTVSTNGKSIHVPKKNSEGRFPGLRPMVISNDKMRDHKMELLEERSFRRWCCSHVVNYDFTEFVENRWEDRKISFSAADIFSDEIQCNPSPGGRLTWHFPVIEWAENDRFCLRLPS